MRSRDLARGRGFGLAGSPEPNCRLGGKRSRAYIELKS